MGTCGGGKKKIHWGSTFTKSVLEVEKIKVEEKGGEEARWGRGSLSKLHAKTVKSLLRG